MKEAKQPRIHVFLATSDIHEELAMAIRTRADFYDPRPASTLGKSTAPASSSATSPACSSGSRTWRIRKNITGGDIEALVLNRRGVSQGDCRLVSHVVNTGHGMPNISCIKLQRGNEDLEDVAIGSDPWMLPSRPSTGCCTWAFSWTASA